MPQGAQSGGCGAMEVLTPCPSPTDISGGCASPGAGATAGGITCLPQEMPAGIPDCGGASTGGGTSCITVDSGCVQISSQSMGGEQCPPLNQGMTVGCPGMGTETMPMPGTPCVIQGKVVEGCPNVTTGGGACPPSGVNGTTPGPNPKPGTTTPGPNPKPGTNKPGPSPNPGTITPGPNPKPGTDRKGGKNGTTPGPKPTSSETLLLIQLL